MDKNDRSSIDSVSVTLGTSKPAQASATSSTPWHILVCADLGYQGSAAERLSAASLPDFLASHSVAFGGTIESAISHRPVYVEYLVKAIDDLQAKKLGQQLAGAAELCFLSETLEDVIRGSQSAAAAAQALKTRPASEAGAMISEALSMLTPAASAATPSGRSAGLDSLLDKMDLTGLPQQADDAAPRAAATLQQLRQQAEELIGAQVGTLLANEQFSRLRTSWICLRHLAKLIGRSREIVLSVASVSPETIDEKIPAVMAALSRDGLPPDIVLLDYPLQITTAHMDVLAALSAAANQHRAMLLAGCDGGESLVEEIRGKDALKPVFDQPRLIPLRRLRQNPATRCTLLALPRLAVKSGDELPAEASAGWFTLFSLVNRIIQEQSPFTEALSLNDLPYGVQGEYPLQSARGISAAAVDYAAEAGLTVLSRETTATYGTVARTLIDPDTAAPLYTYFCYNLLVNRLTKLTALAMSRFRQLEDPAAIELELRKFLLSFLSSYRLITSQEDVRIRRGDDGSFDVAVDSTKTIGDQHLRVRFSFGG
jgi:hypothetical protein